MACGHSVGMTVCAGRPRAGNGLLSGSWVTGHTPTARAAEARASTDSRPSGGAWWWSVRPAGLYESDAGGRDFANHRLVPNVFNSEVMRGTNVRSARDVSKGHHLLRRWA